MERLTEILTDKSYCISNLRAIRKEKFYEDMECRHGFYLYTGKAIDKLAEYEDLEEQGKLLKLPCEIGHMVYEIYQFMGEGAWEIDEHRIRLEDLEKIGKTVFLTKEAAEAALKEMEVNYD